MSAQSALITTPWWWEAAPRPATGEAALPLRVDIAVVGAGYTGVSAALTLARAGASVLLLEADAPGAGASTRNGGMIGSGHRVDLHALAARYGIDTARALLGEGRNALAFTTQLIEREGIECHFRRAGRLRMAWSASDYATLEAQLPLLRDELATPAELVPRARQSREIETPLYHGGCLYAEHGGLHPGLLYNGLWQRARAAGAAICASTRVLRLLRVAPGWRLRTTRGEISADEVVFASNGYTDAATPALRRRVVPVPSYVAVTETLAPGTLQRLLPGGRMMVETRARHCYYRATPDAERILIGARAAVHQITPQRAAPVLQRLLAGIFPSLADVRLTHCWKGNVAFTRNHLPHLGRHGGVWYALGYSGSGVAMAPYLGHKIAQQLLGDESGATAFDRIALRPWPLYDGHPWFLPLVEGYMRYQDWRQRSS